MTDRGLRKHYRTCNLCEAMCGIEITVERDKIKSIKGDKLDPLSHGHICPKATALQDIYEDPDRLKYPVKRTAAGWEEISWDEAYDMVATHVKRIWAEHGHNGMGVYLGNPNVHNLGAILFNGSLIHALRTKNRFTATSVDQLPHHVAARFMFGHLFLIPVPDIERTDYFLMLGANPMASNGSLMTTGGAEPKLKGIQKRGGKIVVIDPRRTETAKMADEHLFIRPRSDALFLLAMANTLFADDLVDLGHLADLAQGVDEVRDLVAPYTPERVADMTGISAADIRRLTHEMCAADSAAIYGRMGLWTQPFGGLCNWLLYVISILSGNFDRAGGMMWPTPAFPVANLERPGRYGRWKSRVRQAPEFNGELPVSALAEEILTEGEGQIKGMMTIAGNPILSTPNGNQLDEAFESLDFYVAIDIYINETTRHADVILPPATGLECEHYDVTFHGFAVRNTAKYAGPLFEIGENQRYDWQIYQNLMRYLATEDRPFNERDPRNTASPSQMLQFVLPSGPHQLTLEKLKENPHGIDLGPLQSQAAEVVCTEDKMIALAPKELTVDLARLDEMFFCAEDSAGDELLLIGRRHVRDNNSWMHNSRRLMKGKNRCVVLMNPADAQARGLENGQAVAVSSRVGQVELPVQVTEEVMAGVVCMPHGYGHGREGVQLATAQAYAGVSINDLTDDLFVDVLTGNAALNGVPVSVAAV